MLDDLRNYLQLASGLTETTASKAKDAATGLLAHGVSLSSKAMPAPDMMGQVQELADDLVATSRNNREMLVGMIRAEVDRNVGRMGFVREDELAALRRHVQRLEKQIADVQQELSAVQRDLSAVQDQPQQTYPAQTYPAQTYPAQPDVDSADAIATAAGDASGLDASGLDASAQDAVSADAAPVAPKKKKKKIIVDPGA